MSETAAHLVDSVLPMTNIRQWVISFPYQFRLCLAVRPKIMARALEITHSVISRYYQQKVGLQKNNSKTGAVTLIQRFGGSLNCNPHFHQLFIDGCYELGPGGEPQGFYTADPPTVAEIEKVLSTIIDRFTKYLIRQRIIVKDNDQEFQLEIPEEDTFAKLQASSITYRFATGPSKGKKALVIKSVPQDGDHNSQKGLVAKVSGFSLHAGVATKANERDKLEKICRYIARPAVSEERLSTNDKGDVVYKFKKPWDDGTSAIKLTPMEFMERLAALVPRPRAHLTRFHGVLGPHYKYRKDIVPKQRPELVMVANPDPDAGGGADIAKAPFAKRMSWARLLKRVFNIDVNHCAKCAGKARIIAAIEDPKVIKHILEHMGLPSSAPRLLPARGPPQSDQSDFFAQESFED